ncbi:hypothetical protein [Haloarchaeobius sp. TZWSO28]|uniref:hypothetical protein n=1 Tax=Haloarchaeobius sp. TZWSO28 TaxID=3446119 RepID=UPI003EB70F3D
MAIEPELMEQVISIGVSYSLQSGSNPNNQSILIQVAKILATLLGGSLATLLGLAFQRHLDRRKELHDNVYGPLLNVIPDYAEGNLHFQQEKGRVSSVWNNITTYQKHQLSSDAERKIEMLDNNIDSLNEFLYHFEKGLVEHGHYGSQTGILMSNEGIKPSIQYKMNSNGTHIRGNSMWKWIQSYAVPVLRAEGTAELAELLELEANRMGYEYAEVFDKWGPEQYKQIGKAIQDAAESTEFPTGIGSRMALYQSIKNCAELSENALTEEIDRPWYPDFIKQTIDRIKHIYDTIKK